jgi:hypothetical protein
MDSYIYVGYEVGDIVEETEYIIPPDRTPWVGIVVYVESRHYELHSYLGQYEDLVGVHWFQPGYIEALPASVLTMLQKAKQKP